MNNWKPICLTVVITGLVFSLIFAIAFPKGADPKPKLGMENVGGYEPPSTTPKTALDPKVEEKSSKEEDINQLMERARGKLEKLEKMKQESERGIQEMMDNLNKELEVYKKQTSGHLKDMRIVKERSELEEAKDQAEIGKEERRNALQKTQLSGPVEDRIQKELDAQTAMFEYEVSCLVFLRQEYLLLDKRGKDAMLYQLTPGQRSLVLATLDDFNNYVADSRRNFALKQRNYAELRRQQEKVRQIISGLDR